MKKNQEVLTPQRFEDLVLRHLIVRVNIRKLPTETGWKHGRLRITIFICSYHRDEDGNQSLLKTIWEYHDPSANFKEAASVLVEDLGNLQDHQQETHERIAKLIQEWKDLWPLWTCTKPHVAYVSGGSKVTEISLQEMHVLQYLSRVQTALAATVIQGHPSQYYLCSLAYSLGDFVSARNREIEESRGLLIRTPQRH